MHKGQWFQCGRVVLTRDPNRQEEACPGGLVVCWDCTEEVGQFLKAAYDARARRKEWERRIRTAPRGHPMSPKRKPTQQELRAMDRLRLGTRFPPGQDKAQLLADRKRKLAQRARRNS
jgi:hypothetical protein